MRAWLLANGTRMVLPPTKKKKLLEKEELHSCVSRLKIEFLKKIFDYWIPYNGLKLMKVLENVRPIYTIK